MPLFLLSTHKQCHFIHNSTAMYPENLIPLRDSNLGLLVLEADAMSSAPRRQGCNNKLFYIVMSTIWISTFYRSTF
jgi:hypothetical protein